MGWLTVRHRLWERGSGSAPASLLHSATLLTLLVGTLVFTAVLLVANGVAAAVIVPPEYLGQVLGRPPGIGDYARIVAMASVLGVVAGAVGSGLEDHAAVRRVAYGHRRRERQQLAPPD